MSQAKPKNPLDVSDVETFETPADIKQETHLSHETAGTLFDLLERRSENRHDGRWDALVVLKDWAVTYPEEDPIAEERVLFVGEVEDYSDDAVFCRGAFHPTMWEVRDADSADDLTLSTVLTQVDEVEDGAQKEGETFLPKSGIETVMMFDGA